ncbi:MAG: hypothetical protein KatS3mg011_1457 [Acidimicrobiia bacterium]|nr:MAG: hypothetical protein KatS3mg011_1457 [Acidimicrobiia bacterium]
MSETTQHPHDHHPEEQRPEEHRHHPEEHVHRVRRTWSPAQVVAGLIGLGLIVLGGVALVRIGFTDLTATATVGWYAHTGILAIIELALGALFLLAAANALDARSSSISLGVLMVAMGLIAVIEPEGTSAYLGDARRVGFTFLVIGVVAALSGLAAPTITTDRDVHHS